MWNAERCTGDRPARGESVSLRKVGVGLGWSQEGPAMEFTGPGFQAQRCSRRSGWVNGSPAEPT